MKVLYIGHYRESGGWAQASKDSILALDHVGVDVVCRNVTLTQDKEISGRLLELEQKDSSGCDVCIQHVLPHHMIGTNLFRKNIGRVETETTSIKHLAWFNMLENMGEVWVPNSDAAVSLEYDNIGVPVTVVPHAADTRKFSQDHRSISIPPAEGKFRFYYVGDVNARKNIETIVRCFHSTFDKTDNAAMIFKINKFGKSNEELKVWFDKVLHDIKMSMRMYPNIEGYTQDITILGDIQDGDINSLHKYCNCYVGPSCGEAWSISAFDAMGFGNTPICSDNGGPPMFIDRDNENTGKLISGVFSTCNYPDPAFQDMFTAREFWFNPCEREICWQMRKYFEEWKKDPVGSERARRTAGLHQAEKFNYYNIGKKMKGLLSE